MTILEAVNVEVNNANLVEKYCIYRSINSSDTYSSVNFVEAEIIKAYCFKALITQPDWSEDGLSVKYNISDLIRLANKIFTDNDLESEIIESGNNVEDKTGSW